MTKREVIQEAWKIATGRSSDTIGIVREDGRGYKIDSAMSGPASQFSRPRDEDGQPLYMVIKHEGMWDESGADATTQADIEEYLFGGWSPLS